MNHIIDDFDIPSLDIHIPELELAPWPELPPWVDLPPWPELDLVIAELPDMELPKLDFDIEPLDFTD